MWSLGEYHKNSQYKYLFKKLFYTAFAIQVTSACEMKIE